MDKLKLKNEGLKKTSNNRKNDGIKKLNSMRQLLISNENI